MIEAEITRVGKVFLGVRPEVQALLTKHGSTPLVSGASLSELIKRPELDYDALAPLDTDRPELPADVREQVNIAIKYEGYIRRQEEQVERFKKLESKRIPEDTDYDQIQSLRLEARLKKLRPESLGQASRISGVSPADVSVLNVWLEKNRRI